MCITYALSHRIDNDGIIKVADFGLAVEEDIGKGYFRQDRSDIVRLPFKWMALESLKDGVFTTKTDVVCSRAELKILLVIPNMPSLSFYAILFAVYMTYMLLCCSCLCPH